MATGLPIVPVVIRNSGSVAGRNATTLNPGTVDIAVLPPISVANWTLDDLGMRIERVRARYVELLGDWPRAVADARSGKS
jgi:putative phosphoserine phosphatase/1-acylglycerol-3-phosphate O-acyltransferase